MARYEEHITLPMVPDETPPSTFSLIAMRFPTLAAVAVNIDELWPIPFCSCSLDGCNAPRHKFDPNTAYHY